MSTDIQRFAEREAVKDEADRLRRVQRERERVRSLAIEIVRKHGSVEITSEIAAVVFPGGQPDIEQFCRQHGLPASCVLLCPPATETRS